jgi:phosphoglycerate dehydrogenase-like enzyme
MTVTGRPNLATDLRSAPAVRPLATERPAPAELGAPAEHVLVTWLEYDADGAQTGARLRDAGLRVQLAPKLGARSSEEMALLARDAVAAIVSTDPFDESVLARAPRLRVIARVGVGTDSIDLDAATRAGVVVTVTPDANRETTADHALALILAALRRVVEHDASVRGGAWERGAPLTPWELHGTVVGLIGYGAIGQAVARRLQGFDVELLVSDPAAPPDGARFVTLEELLRRADVVSLHAPLTPQTRGLLGRRELALLRPSAVLVNTARGGLVDERELALRLRDGRLRAAALDVFADEPLVPDGLRDLPNVVLSPHVGGLSTRSIEEMTRAATQSVLDVLAGRPDPAVVANREVLG